MSDEERKELEKLRREVYLCSLGDRPMCPAVRVLRRLEELEKKEREDEP